MTAYQGCASQIVDKSAGSRFPVSRGCAPLPDWRTVRATGFAAQNMLILQECFRSSLRVEVSNSDFMLWVLRCLEVAEISRRWRHTAGSTKTGQSVDLIIPSFIEASLSSLLEELPGAGAWASASLCHGHGHPWPWPGCCWCQLVSNSQPPRLRWRLPECGRNLCRWFFEGLLGRWCAAWRVKLPSAPAMNLWRGSKKNMPSGKMINEYWTMIALQHRLSNNRDSHRLLRQVRFRIKISNPEILSLDYIDAVMGLSPVMWLRMCPWQQWCKNSGGVFELRKWQTHGCSCPSWSFDAELGHCSPPGERTCPTAAVLDKFFVAAKFRRQAAFLQTSSLRDLYLMVVEAARVTMIIMIQSWKRVQEQFKSRLPAVSIYPFVFP